MRSQSQSASSKSPWERFHALGLEIEKSSVRHNELIAERIEIRKQCIAILHPRSVPLFTNREAEIMTYLLEFPFTRNKELAVKMRISESCVKFHLSNLYLKTDTDSRQELIDKVRIEGMK